MPEKPDAKPVTSDDKGKKEKKGQREKRRKRDPGGLRKSRK